MNRPTIRVIVPETPVFVEACEAGASYVGLGQPPQSSEHRVFILLEAPGMPGCGTMIHVSLDDARFLRDAIETVLERHRVITSQSN
jgi:hypothetical protein